MRATGLRLALSLLSLLFIVASTAPAAQAKKRVLIISIDGVPSSMMQNEWHRTPNLRELARRGAWGSALTIFPSMTWPSHTSIITGCLPAKHGVVGNRWYDASKGKVMHASTYAKDELVKVPTLYDIAHLAGWKTAGIMWAATRDAKHLDVNVVEAYGQSSFEKFSTPGIFKELENEAGLPSDHIGRFNKRSAFFFDSFIRDAAIHTLNKHQPDLMLVHFLAVDSVSHTYGPNNRMVYWAYELVDRYVGDVLQAYKQRGLYDETDIYVVSDHGFMAVTEKLDPNRVLYEAGLIKSIKKASKGPVRTAFNGHALFLYHTKGSRQRMVSTVKSAFAPFRGREVDRIITSGQFAKYGMPTRADNPYAPDIILLSRPSALLRPVKSKDGALRGRTDGGMHGYLPSHPDMKTMFIAAGPSIKKVGQLPKDVRNIDIAPTAARAMGLSFPNEVDGKPMLEILR